MHTQPSTMNLSYHSMLSAKGEVQSPERAVNQQTVDQEGPFLFQVLNISKAIEINRKPKLSTVGFLPITKVVYWQLI